MFKFDIDSKGYIKNRESFNLEYKQNFQLGENLLKYIKTLVGMANNKGGMIVFGIQDSPHIPVGMLNTRLQEIDPKEIDKRIREYFSPELQWKSDVVDFQSKKFGFLIVEEAEEKPIVCKKNKDNIFREGAIYYRYRAETKEIEYSELKKLLEKEKEKERVLWIKHIEKISMVGPKNIHILDKFNGEISCGDAKILIDKSLLEQIRFIKEGHFTDKEGEGIPTLKLAGTIEGMIDTESVVIDPNIIYPLSTQQMQEQLGLNGYQMQAVIYCLDLKNKPKRHTEIANGSKVTIHKYSQSAVDTILKLFEKEGKEKTLDTYVENYKKYRSSISRKRKKQNIVNGK